jgi:hypothetical protein
MTAFPGQGPGKKYQFVTRSGWTLKFWIFKVRSQRMNVGFFNRYKPSGTERWNLSPEFREVAPRGN